MRKWTKRQQYLLISIALFLLAVLGTAYYYGSLNDVFADKQQSAERSGQTNALDISVSLVIEGRNTSVRVPEGSTALDMMNVLQQSTTITFSGTEYPGLGLLVEEINGTKNNAKKGFYWMYYVNGESATVGISQYVLKANDTITWKYEEPKF